MAYRCPVHDYVLEDDQKCPKHGTGTDDCDIHRYPEEHKKAREEKDKATETK